jgi:hypothetical protein
MLKISEKRFKKLHIYMNIIILDNYLLQYSLIMTPTDNEAKLVKIIIMYAKCMRKI